MYAITLNGHGDPEVMQWAEVEDLPGSTEDCGEDPGLASDPPGGTARRLEASPDV